VLGQDRSGSSPKWPYLNDSKIGNGLLLSLTLPPSKPGTRAIPNTGAFVTTDFIYDSNNSVWNFGQGERSPLLAVYDGEESRFDDMLSYLEFNIDFYAMGSGKLNLNKAPRPKL
jgi:hypothetical protein